MILIIALGIFTTLIGVALGSAVLELTIRLLRHSLAAGSGKSSFELKPQRWHAEA